MCSFAASLCFLLLTLLAHCTLPFPKMETSFSGLRIIDHHTYQPSELGVSLVLLPLSFSVCCLQASKGVMLSLVFAALALAVLLLGAADARPCPPNSFFVFSKHHNESHCACARGAFCIGADCTTGHDSNRPISYLSSTHGFPFTCRDCYCRVPGDTYTPPKFKWLRTTDGDSIRDFHDPLFEERCRTVDDAVVPKPRALPHLNWLHFPK